MPRRQIFGAAGFALAATAAPALAEGAALRPHAAEPLQKPVTKNPRPPYKQQSQPWPGLASMMNPKPDHGESQAVLLAGAR